MKAFRLDRKATNPKKSAIRRGGSGELPPAWDPPPHFALWASESVFQRASKTTSAGELNDVLQSKKKVGSKEESPAPPIAQTPPERACATPSYPRNGSGDGTPRRNGGKASRRGKRSYARQRHSRRGLTVFLFRTARQHGAHGRNKRRRSGGATGGGSTNSARSAR